MTNYKVFIKESYRGNIVLASYLSTEDKLRATYKTLGLPFERPRLTAVRESMNHIGDSLLTLVKE